MRFDDESLIREACRYYYRSLKNAIAVQPSVRESQVIRAMNITYIVLRSASSILKIYHLRQDGKLKAHKRFPKELKHWRNSVLL